MQYQQPIWQLIDYIKDYPEKTELPDSFNITKLKHEYAIETLKMENSREILVNYTPLLAWIQYHKNQPIPEALKYRGF